MGLLDNKIAIITGGASGIGKATCQVFAKENATVIVCDVDTEHGTEVANGINNTGGTAEFQKVDVANAQDIQNLVHTTVKKYGRIDVIFNNAGVTRRTNAINTTEQEWDFVMSVNVKSIFLMCKYAIPEMCKTGGGSIINAGSGWGLVGGTNAVSYCASKGAVINMTRALACDHGADNIRVNAICPGDTDTNMLRDEATQLGLHATALVEEGHLRPLQRVGNPHEIAETVVFLASDRSSFVTGTTLVVDGGGLAGSI